MTNVAVPTELAVTTYRAEDLDAARMALTGAGFASEAVWADLTRAAERPGFLLVVGSGEHGPVGSGERGPVGSGERGPLGCAAASLAAGAVLLDPVVTASGLPRLAADRIVTDLVGALLDAQQLPWADVAVRPGSPVSAVLLRAGWRPVKTAPDAPYDVLTGADAHS